MINGGSSDGSVEVIRRYAGRVAAGEWLARCAGMSPVWVGQRERSQSDAAHLMERVHRNLSGMTMTIYRITNAKEVDQTCYMEFAALITKP